MGAGAQGTITISIGGSALSGSFSMRHAQAATSAPEIAPHHLPAPHLLLQGSGGSLIKARPAKQMFYYIPLVCLPLSCVSGCPVCDSGKQETGVPYSL